MSFAEIILRIGSAVGGWLIFLAHALTLAVLGQADCDTASDTLWRGTLVLGGLSGLALVMVGGGLRWSRGLRWLALPAAGLAILAVAAILPALTATTLSGDPLCGTLGTPITPPERAASLPLVASAIERGWPPFQLTVLALGLVQAFRTWRAAARLSD